MEINKALLNASGNFDSARLDQHVDIVKQMMVPGTHQCEVRKNTFHHTNFVIVVSDDNDPGQENIDLSDIMISEARSKVIKLKTGEHLIFYSGWGGDQFEIVIHGETGVIMNSTSVSDEEIIVITPFIPGVYDFIDTGSGANGKMTVERLSGEDEKALQASRAAIMTEGPVNVKIVEGKFEPNTVLLRGDQPMVIVAAKETRIIGTTRKEPEKRSSKSD